MAHRIELIDDLASFDELSSAWDLLADDAAHPFTRHAWIGAWLRSFAIADRLQVYTAWDGERLAGALPLVSRRRMLVAAANAHTPWFSPLGDDAAVSAIADRVARSNTAHVLLGEVAVTSSSTTILARELRTCRPMTWIETTRRAPVVQRSATGGAASPLRGRRRRELQRLGRRLESDEGAVITALARPTDLARELQGALDLEAAGWKGRRQTAILADDSTARFYRDVAAAFHERGELRISSITVGSRLVAFDLCIVSHDRLWIPKGSIDEAYGRYSPGRVLLLAELQAAFDDQLAAVELLGDAEPYKVPFATGFRAHGAVHGARLRPVPIGRLAYRRAAYPLLRRAAHRVRGR